MNTTARRTVDAEKTEKRVWAQPMLARLAVKETAGKENPCHQDADPRGGTMCNPS